MEQRCMLTGSLVISGVPTVLEPTQPGTTTSALVTISLTQYVFGDSGSVQWATQLVMDGATPGQDYTISSGTVNLSHMNTSVQVSVPIKHDLVSEAPEALRVVLSNATGSLAIMVESDTIDILDNNPPPPGPTNPPAPTVWFTSSAMVVMREGESWQLNLSRDMPAGNPGAALTVSYVIAPESVATSADVSLLPAGSVTFAAGQTSATLTVTAIDDSAIEVRERLKLALVAHPAPNQGPGAYIIGNPSEALLDIHDNNEVIFSDLTVDWLDPDGAWVNSPDTELLWHDDQLRWTVTLPPEEVPFAGELTNLKLLKRPHNSSGPWQEISPYTVDPLDPNNPAEFFIYANPLVGDWDITVQGVFFTTIQAAWPKSCL